MSHVVPALVVTALLTACAASSPSSSEDAERLAAAERAFAASARTVGFKGAFLQALADDATLFRPGPVDGRRYIAAQPDPPIRLEWQPARVAVAASDDLGYSSGPYRLTADARPDRRAYGQFFSVWKRDASGTWKLLIDLGVEQPAPQGWTAYPELIARDAQATTALHADGAEAAFATASTARGLVAAYREFGSTTLRVLRDGHAAFDGAAAIADLPDADARWTWTPICSGVSTANDFAWFIGRYGSSGSPSGPSASGFYVRVWRVEHDAWKVLADVLAPIDA